MGTDNLPTPKEVQERTARSSPTLRLVEILLEERRADSLKRLVEAQNWDAHLKEVSRMELIDDIMKSLRDDLKTIYKERRKALTQGADD